MKEDTYAASGLLGKLLCGLRLHKYCDHPEIRSSYCDPEDVFICPKCEQEFTFNGEKFIPLSSAKWCLRGCGHIRVDKPRDKK